MIKKRYIAITLSIFMLIVLLIGCSNEVDTAVESQKEFLMDTIVSIDIYNEADDDAMKNVFARLFEIENRMSKTISTSDISKLNELAGEEFTNINSDTYEVLKKSKNYSKKTEGAFDPTIGKLSNLWRIKENDAERDWIPAVGDIDRYTKAIDFNKIDLEDENMARISSDDVELDLGAIAKGYAADESKEVLLNSGVTSGIVDLGGNLYLIGTKPNGDPWNIGIQNPFKQKGNHMGKLKVENKSVVTSGNYERFFEKDGKRYHHILDPKTGYPSDNELASVTIISDKSISADVYATAFYILGYDKSMKIIEEIDEDIDAIFIEKNGDVHITKGIEGSFELSNKDDFKIVD